MGPQINPIPAYIRNESPTIPYFLLSRTTKTFNNLIFVQIPNHKNTVTMCPTGSSVWPARPISDLRSAFEILDVDHDGKISHQDLKTSYSDADDEVIGSMITVADSNNDGYVEYEEFESVLKSDVAGNSGVLEEVFKAMDGDGDGKVGFSDLRRYLGSAGFEVDDDEIKAMIMLGGGDGDSDGVTFEGFVKILAV
ncbi:putative EF-hand domain-containing protein [Helianthus debilis subsp. tardiflorus]